MSRPCSEKVKCEVTGLSLGVLSAGAPPQASSMVVVASCEQLPCLHFPLPRRGTAVPRPAAFSRTANPHHGQSCENAQDIFHPVNSTQPAADKDLGRPQILHCSLGLGFYLMSLLILQDNAG